jgi:hypothetical protein
MALLETKEKTTNSLGFRRFSLNPGIATNYHSLLSFLSPVVAQYKWNWPFPANSFHLVSGVIDQVEACRLPEVPFWEVLFAFAFVAVSSAGTVPRVPDLVYFCKRHELKMIAIAELVRYRLEKDSEGLLGRGAIEGLFPASV